MPAIPLDAFLLLLCEAHAELDDVHEQRIRAALVLAQPASGALTYQAFCEVVRGLDGGSAVPAPTLLAMYELAVRVSMSVLGTDDDTVLVDAFVYACRAAGL